MTANTPHEEERRLYLEGMSHAACTVNVVTTDGPAGRFGVTVSAMASVSADGPSPVLLVCVHHQSPATAAIVANGLFCVNVLRDSQSHVSDTFAGRRKGPNGDKFGCTQWTVGATGAPRVHDALASFDCRLQDHLQVGTHLVLFGAVHTTAVCPGGMPLIYANRTYGTPAQFVSDAAFDERADWNGLRIGVYASLAPYMLPAILDRMRALQLPPPLRLLEGGQRELVEALRAGAIDVALTYDIELDPALALDTFGSLRPYALLPADHLLARKASVHLAELVDEPFMLYDVAPSRDYFQSLFSAVGLRPHIAYRTSSFELIRGLVGHGLGYSVLGTRPANDTSYDGRPLAARPLADAGLPPSRIVAARLPQAVAPAASQQFVDLCREHLAALC